MTFGEFTEDGLVSTGEIKITLAILALLLAWPWGARCLGARWTGQGASNLALIPVVAASSTAILQLSFLVLQRGAMEVPRQDLARLVVVLGYSSGAAAIGSCLYLLGRAAESLPRGLRSLMMLALAGSFLFGTVGIALIPFGVAKNGWVVCPNPFVACIPLLAGFGVPSLIGRRWRFRGA